MEVDQKGSRLRKGRRHKSFPIPDCQRRRKKSNASSQHQRLNFGLEDRTRKGQNSPRKSGPDYSGDVGVLREKASRFQRSERTSARRIGFNKSTHVDPELGIHDSDGVNNDNSVLVLGGYSEDELIPSSPRADVVPVAVVPVHNGHGLARV